MPEVHRLREAFGINDLVMVGDRGMISQKAIAQLRTHDGIGWITALKSTSIRALLEQGAVQLGLFDERNLFELSHPEFPGERPDRLSQSRTGEAARAQARGPAASDRAQPGEGARECPDRAAAWSGQDWPTCWQSHHLSVPDEYSPELPK